MKKLLAALGATLFIGMSAILSTGAPIPLLPASSGCNEASQLLYCLNLFGAFLNGAGQTQVTQLFTGGATNTGAIDGITASSLPCTGNCSVNAGLGPGSSAGIGSGFTPVVLNGQRGVVTFLTPLGSGNATIGAQSSTLMVSNSFVNAQSNCQATLQGNSSGGLVTVDHLTPTSGTTGFPTGTLNITLANLGNTALVTATYSIGFWCQ